MLSLLKHGLWIPIEGAINQVLIKHPDMQNELAKYESKHVQITIHHGSKTDLLILNQGIHLGEFSESSPDAAINASAQNFIALLVDNNRSNLNSNKFELTGDETLIEELFDIFSSTQLGWDKLLSPYFGSTLGNTGNVLAQKISSGIAFVKQQHQQNFAKNPLPNVMKDFLEQEASLLANQQQMKSFSEQINKLDQQVDQLIERAAGYVSKTGGKKHDG